MVVERRKLVVPVAVRAKRKSGIPTGNAGEYFVMGELLRQGYDAQLADRNTKGYDIAIGNSEDDNTEQFILHKLQVKTVRSAPWYVKKSDFIGNAKQRITIYVLIGAETNRLPVRYFIVRNGELADKLEHPHPDKNTAYMPLKAVKDFENNWNEIKELVRPDT